MEKMHTIYSEKRPSGISLIDSLMWGTNFCQFYETEESLFEIIIPYFKAGLENNEFCVWVVSDTFNKEDLIKTFGKFFPDIKYCMNKGQMVIIPEQLWKMQNAGIDEAILSRLDHAILSGFDGLRFASNGVNDEKELKIDLLKRMEAISRFNIISLFYYPAGYFDTIGLMEVVKKHKFALVWNADHWEVIESSGIRNVEDALKRSEENLSALFENMSEGFAYHRIVLDDNGIPCDYIFLEINEAFEMLTGLKRENIIGKRVTEALPGIEKDPTDWINKYGGVALTGKQINFENYSELLDKWYSVSAYSPHKGYFSVIFNDITDRKKMEKTLKENEERLRITLRSIGDAVIATDRNGLITFMNPIAENLTGWTLTESLNKDLEDVFNIINRDTRQQVENPVKKVLRCGNIVGLANHTRLIAKNGNEIPIDDSAAPIRDDNGNLTGVVLVFRDVTERVLMEEELYRSKEEWELTFNTVPDMIAILDRKHQVQKVNRTMADRLGLPPEQCIGLHCYEVVHGTKEAPAFCPHSLTCGDGEEHIIEVHEPRIGGDFLVSTTALCDNEDNVIGTVHVARDISDLKRAEKELRIANDQLEDRVKEKTAELQISNKALVDYTIKLEKLNEEMQDFVFAAAHDLQEPLRKVQTFSNMLLEGPANLPDKTVEEYLERMNASASRMRQLLNDLLQFSKITTKPKSVTPVDLGKIAWEAAGLFEEDLKKSDGRLEIENLPAITADETQILRLFQNLISNALKYRSEKNPCIKIYSKNNGNYCEILVKDNGIGFDQKYNNQIFKPFRRLHPKNKFGGSGIGLAICRKIAESHGGSINAESEPGEGSTFIVRLPCEN